MPAELLSALVGLGAPGIAFGVLLWLYLRLQRRSEETQERRVQDAQKMTDALLAMQRDHNETLNRLSAGMDGHTAALEALKDAVRDLRTRGGSGS